MNTMLVYGIRGTYFLTPPIIVGVIKIFFFNPKTLIHNFVLKNYDLILYLEKKNNLQPLKIMNFQFFILKCLTFTY
jgi:hypothetical protein